MDVFDKFTLEKIGQVKKTPLTGIADLGRRLPESAGSFSSVEMEDRKLIIEKLSSLIAAFSEELAALVTAETGKPIEYSRTEVTDSLNTLRRLASGLTEHQEDGLFSSNGSFPRNPGLSGSLLYRAGYAHPALDFIMATGIGLSTGMAVVFVPDRFAPLSPGMILGKLMGELPEGLVNIVIAEGAALNKVMESANFGTYGFSGKPSDLNGFVKRIGIRNYFSSLQENYPVIIWDEENIDSIIEEVTTSSYYSGNCYYDRAWKVIVKKEIFEYAKNRIAEISGNINVGDPRDPMNSMGPVTDSNELLAASIFSGKVKSGLGEVVMDGKVEGNVMRPTFVVPGERIDLENPNIGVPFTMLAEADSIDGAIEQANYVTPGSGCALYVNDIDIVKNTVGRLNYSSVYINTLPRRNTVMSMVPRISFGLPGNPHELKPQKRLII